MVAATRLATGYGGRAVLSDVDFELGAGMTLALVGANGSGKSTLLKTIAGLLVPLSGTVRVFGERPGASPARVAFLSQFRPSDSILPLRAIDVVRMARFSALGLLSRPTREDERLVRQAMEVMGTADLESEPLNSLSAGQRQRVFLAQAFARAADLFLLDEPQTNLDAAGKEVYRTVLRESVAAGSAAVIATHDIDEAARCDRVMLLAGRVVAYGPGNSVLTPQTLLAGLGATTGTHGRYEG